MFSRIRLEEGWSTLFLLWLMIVLPAMAIHQADLIDGLEILPFIGSMAILAGILLGKSRFSDRTAHVFSLVYGLAVVTYMIGTILPGDLVWREKIFDMVARQADWIGKALSQGTSRDSLIFVMHTAAVFWLLGYTASWYTFRKPRVWRVVLPSGLVLLSVIYYYYGPKPLATYLALYVLVALVYVARTHLVDQEKIWRAASVSYEGAIRFRFLRASFLVAVVALMIAWSLPTMTASAAVNDALSSTGVNNNWKRFQDNWTRLFSSLRSYGSGVNDPYRDSLVLGGPRSIGTTPVMDIYVPHRLPYVYWQAIAMDNYQDGRWTISSSEKVLHFPDEGVFNVPFTFSREVITQTVVNYWPNSSILYGAPEIIGSDQQMLVTLSYDSSGNSLVNSVQSRFVMRPGDIYRVQSSLSVADASSLREAPVNYPDWVSNTYLQVPDSITPETSALAAELVAPYDNPFDKAIAVRDYLRRNITYNDQIAAPPEGVEPVHYTLFVSKEGYCDYYATAMALMLRSQGIAARVVFGYAQGEFDEDTSSYRVRASDAHTWVEVFFPGYGWIQFEPTASLPPADRPETTAGEGGDAFASPSLINRQDEGIRDFLPEDEFNGPERDFENLPFDLLGLGLEAQEAERRASAWRMLGAVMVVGMALASVVTANKLNRQVESSVEKSYGRLESWARWLGVFIQPVHTPYERADLIASAVPEAKPSIRNLTQQFVLQRFSRTRAADETFDPLEEWRILRPLMLRRSIATLFERLRSRRGY